MIKLHNFLLRPLRSSGNPRTTTFPSFQNTLQYYNSTLVSPWKNNVNIFTRNFAGGISKKKQAAKEKQKQRKVEEKIKRKETKKKIEEELAAEVAAPGTKKAKVKVFQLSCTS